MTGKKGSVSYEIVQSIGGIEDLGNHDWLGRIANRDIRGEMDRRDIVQIYENVLE